MIDCNRYPEVEIASNVGGKATVPLINKSFGTYGIPEAVKTDGGPRGTYGVPEAVKTDGGPRFSGHEFPAYARWTGFMHQKTTPEDPEADI